MLFRCRQMELALRRRTIELTERMKELSCLYDIDRLLERRDEPFDVLMEELVSHLLKAWQYPEVTSVRVRVGNLVHCSGNWRDTPWRLTAPIQAGDMRFGSLDVGYLASRPPCHEGPFLKEERALIDAVAERLGLFLLYQNAEDALRASERRYRTLVDSMADAVLLVERETGRILDVNAAGTQMFGHSRQAMRQLTRAELLAAPVEPATHEGQPALLHYQRKDGTRFPADVMSRSTLWEGREAYVEVIRDVTERQRAQAEKEQLERQVRQAQRMEALGQLAGGVAHDFNNFLQAILGFLDLAMMRMPPDMEELQDLKQAREAGRRASTLVRQLLAFSRRQALEPRRLDINHTVAQMLKMLRHLVGERVKLEFQPSQSLPDILADEGQIEQVLMNLCLNARDAMPDGGRLVIETRAVHAHATPDDGQLDDGASRFVQLTVSDNGIGMPREIRERIFDPFFTTKEVGQGTGLGLANVYGIVKQHGGSVDVVSRPGHGSTFRICLPQAVGETDRDADHTASTRPRGGAELILLAEDDMLVRELEARVLEDAGYKVLAAADGEEAMRLFDSHADAVQLALLDVMMPRAGGLEVREHICRRTTDLPIIFFSGHGQGVHEIQTILAEGYTLIQKPVDHTRMLLQVRQALDRARM